MDNQKLPVVLTIDDEPAVRESFRHFLEDYDYVVLEAENGRVGLEMFAHHQPDLVLVDLRMPELDGLEVLTAIRQCVPDMPVIVISGTGMIRDVVEALHLGAWDYLLKPIEDLSVLLHAVEKALERSRLLRQNQRYQTHLEAEVARRTEQLAQTNRELQQLNQRLRQLVGTIQRISRTSRLDQFGRQLLEECGQQMAVSGGSLYRVAEDGLRLLHALDSGHAPAFLPFPLAPRSVLQRVLSSRHPLLLEAIGTATGVTGSGWQGYRDGSLLVFPLLGENQQIAALFALHNKLMPPFNEQDLELGTVLVSYCQEAWRALHASEALHRSEQKYRLIFEQLQDVYCEMLLDGTIVEISPSVATVLHYRRDELLYSNFWKLCNRPEHRGRLLERLQRQGKVSDYEVSLRNRGGQTVICSITARFGSEPVGTPSRICGTLRDISDRKQAENALRASEVRHRTVLNTMREGLITLDEAGLVQSCNPAAEQIFQYHAADLVGQPFTGLLSRPEQPDDRRLLEQCLANRQAHEMEGRQQNGKVFPLELSAAEMRLGEQRLFNVLVRDITERKQAEVQIERQAYYDALTQLPNRTLLLDRLQQALARTRRHGQQGAVLFLDLDRFKNINDSLGHSVGDSLLQEVATRLSGSLRQEDTAARLGGDEFVVLLNELGSDAETTARHAQGVADKLRELLSRPYLIAGYELYVTPSIGIALFQTGSEPVDDILKHADAAMYQSKADGRNTSRFYLPAMQAAADERLALEKDLRVALSREELSLYFQPQLDADGRVIGAEALLRWQHPQRGMVPPTTFIPVAEETGLIHPLGEWVLWRACLYLKEWGDAGFTETFRYLAVNVSPWQFRQIDFVAQVERILQQTGAKPGRLALELTEGVVIDNVADTIVKMQALQRLGVHFSMDDFGTGYSSLTYLKQLPLDVLKIDKSFVRDVATDPNDAAIVATIIAMASHLGLAVIAEGVETDTELDFLYQHGCRAYQGYYFSRPLPAVAFQRFLAGQHPPLAVRA